MPIDRNAFLIQTERQRWRNKDAAVFGQLRGVLERHGRAESEVAVDEAIARKRQTQRGIQIELQPDQQGRDSARSAAALASRREHIAAGTATAKLVRADANDKTMAVKEAHSKQLSARRRADDRDRVLLSARTTLDQTRQQREYVFQKKRRENQAVLEQQDHAFAAASRMVVHGRDRFSEIESAKSATLAEKQRNEGIMFLATHSAAHKLPPPIFMPDANTRAAARELLWIRDLIARPMRYLVNAAGMQVLNTDGVGVEVCERALDTNEYACMTVQPASTSLIGHSLQLQVASGAIEPGLDVTRGDRIVSDGLFLVDRRRQARLERARAARNSSSHDESDPPSSSDEAIARKRQARRAQKRAESAAASRGPDYELVLVSSAIEVTLSSDMQLLTSTRENVAAAKTLLPGSVVAAVAAQAMGSHSALSSNGNTTPSRPGSRAGTGGPGSPVDSRCHSGQSAVVGAAQQNGLGARPRRASLTGLPYSYAEPPSAFVEVYDDDDDGASSTSSSAMGRAAFAKGELVYDFEGSFMNSDGTAQSAEAPAAVRAINTDQIDDGGNAMVKIPTVHEPEDISVAAMLHAQKDGGAGGGNLGASALGSGLDQFSTLRMNMTAAADKTGEKWGTDVEGRRLSNKYADTGVGRRARRQRAREKELSRIQDELTLLSMVQKMREAEEAAGGSEAIRDMQAQQVAAEIEADSEKLKFHQTRSRRKSVADNSCVDQVAEAAFSGQEGAVEKHMALVLEERRHNSQHNSLIDVPGRLSTAQQLTSTTGPTSPEARAAEKALEMRAAAEEMFTKGDGTKTKHVAVRGSISVPGGRQRRSQRGSFMASSPAVAAAVANANSALAGPSLSGEESGAMAQAQALAEQAETVLGPARVRDDDVEVVVTLPISVQLGSLTSQMDVLWGRGSRKEDGRSRGSGSRKGGHRAGSSDDSTAEDDGSGSSSDGHEDWVDDLIVVCARRPAEIPSGPVFGGGQSVNEKDHQGQGQQQASFGGQDLAPAPLSESSGQGTAALEDEMLFGESYGSMGGGNGIEWFELHPEFLPVGSASFEEVGPSFLPSLSPAVLSPYSKPAGGGGDTSGKAKQSGPTTIGADLSFNKGGHFDSSSTAASGGAGSDLSHHHPPSNNSATAGLGGYESSDSGDSDASGQEGGCHHKERPWHNAVNCYGNAVRAPVTLRFGTTLMLAVVLKRRKRVEMASRAPRNPLFSENTPVAFSTPSPFPRSGERTGPSTPRPSGSTQTGSSSFFSATAALSGRAVAKVVTTNIDSDSGDSGGGGGGGGGVQQHPSLTAGRHRHMSMKHAARHTIPRHILPPRLLRERVWLFMFVPYKTTTVKPVGLLGGVASEGTGGGFGGATSRPSSPSSTRGGAPNRAELVASYGRVKRSPTNPRWSNHPMAHRGGAVGSRPGTPEGGVMGGGSDSAPVLGDAVNVHAGDSTTARAQLYVQGGEVPTTLYMALDRPDALRIACRYCQENKGLQLAGMTTLPISVFRGATKIQVSQPRPLGVVAEEVQLRAARMQAAGAGGGGGARDISADDLAWNDLVSCAVIPTADYGVVARFSLPLPVLSRGVFFDHVSLALQHPPGAIGPPPGWRPPGFNARSDELGAKRLPSKALAVYKASQMKTQRRRSSMVGQMMNPLAAAAAAASHHDQGEKAEAEEQAAKAAANQSSVSRHEVEQAASGGGSITIDTSKTNLQPPAWATTPTITFTSISLQFVRPSPKLTSSKLADSGLCEAFDTASVGSCLGMIQRCLALHPAAIVCGLGNLVHRHGTAAVDCTALQSMAISAVKLWPNHSPLAVAVAEVLSVVAEYELRHIAISRSSGKLRRKHEAVPSTRYRTVASRGSRQKAETEAALPCKAHGKRAPSPAAGVEAGRGGGSGKAFDLVEVPPPSLPLTDEDGVITLDDLPSAISSKLSPPSSAAAVVAAVTSVDSGGGGSGWGGGSGGRAGGGVNSRSYSPTSAEAGYSPTCADEPGTSSSERHADSSGGELTDGGGGTHRGCAQGGPSSTGQPAHLPDNAMTEACRLINLHPLDLLVCFHCLEALSHMVQLAVNVKHPLDSAEAVEIFSAALVGCRHHMADVRILELSQQLLDSTLSQVEDAADVYFSAVATPEDMWLAEAIGDKGIRAMPGKNYRSMPLSFDRSSRKGGGAEAVGGGKPNKVEQSSQDSETESLPPKPMAPDPFALLCMVRFRQRSALVSAECEYLSLRKDGLTSIVSAITKDLTLVEKSRRDAAVEKKRFEAEKVEIENSKKALTPYQTGRIDRLESDVRNRETDVSMCKMRQQELNLVNKRVLVYARKLQTRLTDLCAFGSEDTANDETYNSNRAQKGDKKKEWERISQSGRNSTVGDILGSNHQRQGRANIS